MEYGAVEAGLGAHTHPSGDYPVFWRSHILTSLYPRAFPLARYEIGSEDTLPPEQERVAGRIRRPPERRR